MLWRIFLFGGPKIERTTEGRGTQSRFRSRKVSALLAYLALHFEKPCSRESLLEALWPDETDLQVAQNRFRVTLASLRKQLEPEGFPFGSVLDTSLPGCVSLRTGATWCDLAEFEKAHSAGDLSQAASFLTDPLLPGIYEDWATDAQVRFEVLREELAQHPSDSSRPDPEKQRELAHALPLFVSSFVGREKELATLHRLLEAHRLVNLTGPGGVGKTRLSVEACKLTRVRTIFVPLADCTSSDSIAEKILVQLGIGTQNLGEPNEQLRTLMSHMGSVRLLLDNAEHIVEEVAPIVEAILTEIPQVSILVSSRRTLEVAGEQLLRLEPLELPTEAISPDELSNFSATRLFLDRLRQSRPDFSAKPEQANDIVEICKKLDGLPLAIELAAAQITVQNLPEILTRLSENLVDLKSRLRSVSPRHRSLRAAVESSLQGLDSEQSQFLGKLAVFWGGFTADLAVEVTEDPSALDYIDDLVQRSLIYTQTQQDQIRFYCLEVVRHVAQERLSVEDRAEIRLRHQEVLLRMFAGVDERDLRTLALLSEEIENLEIALETLEFSSPQFWDGSRGAILHAFIRGQHRLGLKWIRNFAPHLAKFPNYEVKRGWITAALRILPDLGLLSESRDLINQLRSAAISNGDPLGEIEAEVCEGLVAARSGDTSRAVAIHRKALVTAQQLGDSESLENALSHLSGSLHEIARLPGVQENDRIQGLLEAEIHAVSLISMVSVHSRRHPLSRLLAGAAIFYQGRLDDASHFFEEANASADRLGIRSVRMYCAYFEAEIARLKGDAVKEKEQLNLHNELRELTGIQFEFDR